MLAGVAAEDLGVEQMHLRMALSSLRVEEPNGAVHHMQHAISVAAGEAEHELEEIQDLIVRGDHAGADPLMLAFLGETGASDSHRDEAAHDDDEAAHDDDEEHATS